jgi:hypothetical protein
MRPYVFTVFLLLVFQISFAQIEYAFPEGLSSRCGHARDVASGQDINYYQYPSMNKYDLKYLKLDLSVMPGSRTISGTGYTEFEVIQALDSFITEFADGMIVDSVFINNVKLTFNHSNDHIFVPISPSLAPGSTGSALIYYHGTASSSGVFAGTTGALTYTATLSESYQAREWFPIKQFLQDKIDSADIWITMDAGLKAGSNGLLVDSVDKPSGKRQFQWKTRYPMNYYVVSFAVGNYMEYDNYAHPAVMAPDSILIQNYFTNDPAYFAAVKTNIDKVPPFMEKMSELYGLYPFKDEKYGHCQAAIGGGMEHQTMSTMVNFTTILVAHELAHQWWGDNVTCAKWNDIWLNEGFASYCGEYLMIKHLPALIATDTTTYMQNWHNNIKSSPTGSVYVPEASVYNESRIFSNRLSYQKGGAILHTLRFFMQDDNKFYETLRQFQNDFGDSVATGNDFRAVAETTSGMDFSDFFNQWYYGEGYPTHNITYFMQGSDTIILLVNETVSAPGVTPFFSGLLELRITSLSGDTTVKVNLSANNQQFKFAYNKIPNGIVVDPDNWIINNTGTITNGGTIPLRLISFEGASDVHCNALLSWKTQFEQNETHFEIEYSTDGITFNTVGNMPGSDNSGIESYHFEYPLLNAGNYFRLKIFEIDGTYTYSNIIPVSKTCNIPYSVHVNPNPVRNDVRISIRQSSSARTHIKLVNANGQVLMQLEKEIPAGESVIPIDVRKLPSGSYVINISGTYGSLSKKFVKL